MFEKSSVIRQPNAFKSQRPSVLGKPTTFSNSFVRKDFSKSTSVTKNNVSNDFSKPVTAHNLPTNKKPCLKNANVLAPGMYKLHTDHTQARTSKLPQDSKKTNKRMSFSTGVIPTTSVSRPQLKSNPQGDRVMHNNSRGKKLDIEEHRRNVKFPRNKTSITACNDNLNAKTMNVCFCYETVASESNKKPRNNVRKLYERLGKIYKWSYIKFTPSAYIWKPKSPCQSESHRNVLFIVNSGCSKHMTGNLKILINFVEKFLGTVKFGNDQIAPILGYGDLVQGPITIKRVYYVEGMNHNLFSVGQFCDADLEIAFRKSTCFIRDLKGNDLLTDFRNKNKSLTEANNKLFETIDLLYADFKKSKAELKHRDNIEYATEMELETLQEEKDVVDGKLARLLKSSKDLENIIESQRSKKVKEGVGYNAVPPPAADLYLSPKKDLSWTGLPEFVDDTVTNYSRPSPTVASSSSEDQNKDTSTSEEEAPTKPSKPFVKFVKPKDSQPESKLKEQETPKKPQVKYFEQNRQRRVQRETNRSQNHSYKSSTHRSAGHRPNGAHMRPPLRSSGPRPHGNSIRPPFRAAGHRTHGPSMNPRRPTMNVNNSYRAPLVPTVNRYVPPVNKKFSTGRRNFPTPIGNFPLLAENLPLVAQKVTLLIWEGREKLAVPRTTLMTKVTGTVAALGT
nr:integrase, catalytic region, zinc finger, CCHC-type, peptidase aspartic, catalytic [Tanacetum cinerariifolium]